ncbi:ABC transporter permease [Microvirga vignae]|uniref:ABC transporter permease n=1 Tax=Microvirga vignae TaxID=1225564 RepID=UPI0009FBD47E|nr:iron ABC transporter permease [Microvirga vignae]
MKRQKPIPSFLERGGLSLLALPALLLLLLDLLPAARLLLAAVAPGSLFDPGKALEVVASRPAYRAMLATMETAFASSLLSLLLGGMMALFLGVTDLRGRKLASFLFFLSMMISPQVVALAFLHLAGPASPLLGTLGLAPAPGSANPMLGRNGIALVLGLHHAPLVFVILLAGLKRVPRAIIEAARVDGARPWRIVIDILLPLLRPHLVGAALLAFVAGAGNFGIPALLGTPVNYLTLPVLIYRRLSSFGPGVISDVAALGLLMALVAALCVLTSQLLMRSDAVQLEEDAPLQPFWRLGRLRVVAQGLVIGTLAMALGLPILSLLAASLVPSYGMPLSLSTMTLDNFVEVLVRQDVTKRAFQNSFLFAAGAACLLAMLSLPLAYVLIRRMASSRRAVQALLEISYVLPGVVLAIACILLFLKPLPLIGISLYATPWIIVFAYLARFLPVVLKPVLAGMEQVDLAQEEAAALDGAGLMRRLLDLILPSLLPAAAAGGLMAFLLAFSELTVSALLWSAGTETIGVVLYNLEEAGLASQASAVAIATVAVVAVAMLLLDAVGSYLPDHALPWQLSDEPESHCGNSASKSWLSSIGPVRPLISKTRMVGSRKLPRYGSHAA